MGQSQIGQYLDRQTVIIGSVNSGKTTQTLQILQFFLNAGYGDRIAVLDCAPDPVQGIGGKLNVEKEKDILYLTAPIIAPRLMGRDESHTWQLAEENQKVIEQLFALYEENPRDILFINDVTLYLQAGNINRLTTLLENSSTRIINAYYGNAFVDSKLSQRERKLTRELIAQSSRIIER